MNPRDESPLEGELPTGVFVFESSTHVFWAEEVAREEGIPVEVIPAPEAARDRCGLAIRTLQVSVGGLADLLEEEGIPFEVLRIPGE